MKVPRLPTRYTELVRRLPEELRWVFWDLDFDTLEVEADADSILARVLEHGRLSDVRIVLKLYGEERIHQFFRSVGHPLISDRTTHFWRAFFRAEDEEWV